MQDDIDQNTIKFDQQKNLLFDLRKDLEELKNTHHKLTSEQ